MEQFVGFLIFICDMHCVNIMLYALANAFELFFELVKFKLYCNLSQILYLLRCGFNNKRILL